MSCFEQLLILVSAVTWCVSVSAFASLVGITIELTCSEVQTKICAIIAGIKKYKKNKEKHDKIG